MSAYQGVGKSPLHRVVIISHRLVKANGVPDGSSETWSGGRTRRLATGQGALLPARAQHPDDLTDCGAKD